MCESVESLIKLINDGIKNANENMLDYMKKINDFEKSKSTFNDEIKNIYDDLTLTIKTLKKLKSLKYKFGKIKSEIDSLSMFAYKPERMDTDDEEKLIEEERKDKRKIMRLIRIRKSDSESESE